jgi:hypothetical protein
MLLTRSILSIVSLVQVQQLTPHQTLVEHGRVEVEERPVLVCDQLEDVLGLLAI